MTIKLQAMVCWRTYRMLFVLLIAVVTSPAHGHFTPNTEIGLDFRGTAVAAHIVIPEAEYRYAYGRAFSAEAFLPHISARTDDGRDWTVRMKGARLDRIPGSTDIVVDLVLIPPNGASPRRFALTYDAVIDRAPGHIALVHAAADFGGGVLRDAPALLGAVQSGRTSIAIDRGAASGWRGFLASLRLGMRHIAEGYDHLAFLFTLLLPAPLIASQRRWDGRSGARETFGKLIRIITAFTVGHSLTLIGGAFFGWALPSRPVEVAIAVSVLVSAFHALRPVFPGREAWVAGGFGLIHGMAFATVLANFDLPPLARGQAILGFNLGIELVQLALMLLVAPLLMALARTAAYRPFRLAGGTTAAVAALWWVWQRL